MHSRNISSYDNNTNYSAPSTSIDFYKLLGKKHPTKLHEWAGKDNISEDFDKEKLQTIAGRLLAGIEEDKNSSSKWLSNVEDAQRLAKLVKEPKNTPLPQSANIKFPLITNACNQFAARTYPEIIQDGKIVKGEVIGQSSEPLEALAQAISTHMSYQLLGSDSEWEASTDKLLVVLPNVGFVLKKTYFDTLKKKNVSDLCLYSDIILRNDTSIQCLGDLRRITHVLHCHPNDLLEKARAGVYSKYCVEEILNHYSDKKINPECDLYECHCFLDLDDDQYEEPYIVTMHKGTNKIVRIVARYSEEDISYETNEIKRIDPIQYFTDYHFIPAPDGSFMSLGFGTLLLHLNETVNTILNQLIDAGALANLQTGFIDSRIKIMGGQLLADPGQWTRVKGVTGQLLKEGVLPINYKEPSTVLFQLLQLLVQTAKDLTSSTDALQGSINATNVPATSMLAMIEQGMKMFSAIQKRLYRSLKEEYQKIFRLNKMYLSAEDIISVLGNDLTIDPNIYKTNSVRVIPIADPNLSSDAQRLAQAQVIMGLSSQSDSLLDKYEAQKRMLQAAKVSNIEMLLPQQNKQQGQQQKPDPRIVKIQADAARHGAELQLKGRVQDLREKEFAAKLSKIEAEITQMQANAVKLVSDADVSSKQTGIQALGLQLDTIKSHIQALTAGHQQAVDQDISNKELMLEHQKMQNQHLQAMSGMALQQQQQEHNQRQDLEAAANENNSGTNSNMGDAPSNPENDSSAPTNETGQ